MAHARRLMTVGVALLLISAVQGRAFGDEVYICAGNKVVRVALDQLEHMKRSNACVASHYGLEIKKKTAPVASSKPPPGKGRAGLRRQAVKKPPVTTRRKQPAAKAVTARTLPEKKAAASAMPKAQQRPTPPAVAEIAAKPSDYRNIRVLNAKSKAAQWYRHVY